MGIADVYKKFVKMINNIDNPVTVDPSRFNDPVALKTQWSPMPSAKGANFCTSKLIQTDELVMKFLPTNGARLFFAAFIAVSVSILYLFMIEIQPVKPLVLLIPVFFIGIGLYGLIFILIPAVFDKTNGEYYKGRKKPSGNDIRQEIKDFVNLNNVHALQLLKRFNNTTDSDGMSNSYYSFELNLVLHDGKRINVVSHGNLLRMRADAQTLSDFLNVPLWDAV